MARRAEKTPTVMGLPVESGVEATGGGETEQSALFLVELKQEMETSLKVEVKKKTTIADYLRLLGYLEQHKGAGANVKEIVVRWQEPQMTDGLNT